MIDRHWDGIASYCRSENKVSLGLVEGLNSVGRSDRPGLDSGGHEALVESIKTRLFRLPDETMVLPGHGKSTTIGHEKLHNSCLI